jgi:predicted nucleic acid-binding protein
VSLAVIKDDPDDDRILECAANSGSDYIITGDKDLLRLGQYDSIRILNVSDFLDTRQVFRDGSVGHPQKTKRRP